MIEKMSLPNSIISVRIGHSSNGAFFPVNRENLLILNRYIVKMISNIASENSSCNIQLLEISFATSNKGNPLIICDNYLFRCNK